MRNIGKEELQYLKDDLKCMISLINDLSQSDPGIIKFYEDNLKFIKKRYESYKEYLKSDKHREIHIKWVNKMRRLYRLNKKRISRGISKYIVIKSLFRRIEVMMAGRKAGEILRRIKLKNKKERDLKIKKNYKEIKWDDLVENRDPAEDILTAISDALKAVEKK